jgi:hypothetical protein
MSKTLQFRRYTTTNLATITGAAGELIVDTNQNTLTVGDGSTSGGTYLATQGQLNANNTIQNGINTSQNTGITTAAANTIYLQGALNTANTNIAAAAQTRPQNAQTASYVLDNTDAGKHLYYTNGSVVNLYIPWTSNTTFNNGTTIQVISHSSSNVTVSPNTGVSLFAAGNTTSGNHNVTTYGVATLIQVAANTWYIHGTGVV